MYTNKKREGINTFVCAVSLYVAETPKASLCDHELPLPLIPFGIVAYGSVRTTSVEIAVYRTVLVLVQNSVFTFVLYSSFKK